MLLGASPRIVSRVGKVTLVKLQITSVVPSTSLLSNSGRIGLVSVVVIVIVDSSPSSRTSDSLEGEYWNSKMRIFSLLEIVQG